MIQLYQTLDLRPIGIPQTLRLSQYDSDFEIIFELTNFDGAWILDTNTTAEIQGTKTDGHGYSADAVFDSTNLTVTIAGDVQMTAAAGRNTFEVVLFHDGDRLGSKNFILDVERAALDAETTQSDSKIKNFTEMVEAAEDAAETATAAAEAAEEAAASMEPSMTDDAKNALLACLRGVAWLDDNGAELYEALEYALFAAVTSITADFVQGTAEFYTNNTLDDLRSYLTVTARYSDGTTEVVTDYTLSGELTVGESIITATYRGKTATFTVTVTSRRRSELPAAYEQVEYIMGTGTQYLSTGILSQIPIGVRAKLAYGGNDTNVISARNGSDIDTSIMFTGLVTIGGTTKYLGGRCGYNNWVFASTERALNTIYDVVSEVVAGSNNSTLMRVKVDDEAFAEATVTNVKVGYPITLCIKNGDTWIGRKTEYYSVVIYSGSDVLFDGIPCYRKSDDKTGLYDAVTNAFFPNEGTGEFEIGNVVY